MELKSSVDCGLIGVLFVIVTTVFAGETGLDEIWGVVGGRVELPCTPKPKIQNDSPVLVLWYLASNTTPIYSYDARLGDFTNGERWADAHSFGVRSYFSAVSEPPSLVLEPLHSGDGGIYTCRIDYRRSPSTTYTNNLTVIVPPGPPVVLWNNQGVVGSVGPLQENSPITLMCRSSGGRPPPTLTWWWRGTKLSHQTSNVTFQHRFRSLLVETSVRLRATRGLHGALLTCHAHPPSPPSPNRHLLLQPRTASVSLNITLSPLELSISGIEGPVSAGSAIQLKCKSVGSNPPAELTWWRGHTHLKEDVIVSVEDGGNITTSTLTLVTSREHDRATLACTAANPLLPNSPVTRTVKLEVLYPPVATLRLGSVLNSSNIEEGADIFFECDVQGNPEINRIDWQHNGVLLQHKIDEGIVMSGFSLALQKLKKTHSGAYNCVAYNNEGRNISNTLHLTVRHAPQCANGISSKTIGSARGSPALLTCHVDAVPAKNISWEWVKIRDDNTEEKIPIENVRKNGLTSSVILTPISPGDYGYVTCRASNAIGRQHQVCLLHLVPAGPPDSPTNCTVTNVNIGFSPSLNIACHEGFDGGLPQEFLLEVHQDKEIFANLTSEYPEWDVDDLDTGVSVTIKVTAQNAHGKSEAVRLEVHTPMAQHREAIDSSTKNKKTLLGATTLLGALVGVLVVLVILIVVSVVIARHSKPRPKTKPTIVSTTPVDSTWECYNPDLVSSAKMREPNRESISISQHSLPSPRLSSLMQRHRNPSIPVHEDAQSYIQMHKQSLPHILINNHPPKHSSQGELTGFDIRDSSSNTSIETDVESVIEVTTLATRGLMNRTTNGNRCHSGSTTNVTNLTTKPFGGSSTLCRSSRSVAGDSEVSRPLLKKDENNFLNPNSIGNLSNKSIPNSNTLGRMRNLPKTPEINSMNSNHREIKQEQMSPESTPPPKPPRIFVLTQSEPLSNSQKNHARGSKDPLTNSCECVLKELSLKCLTDSSETNKDRLENAPLAKDEVNGAYKDREAARKLNGVAGKTHDKTKRYSPSRETSI